MTMNIPHSNRLNCLLWGAVLKKINTFLSTKHFFCVQHHLVFVDMKYFFCGTSIADIKQFSRAKPTCFCRHQITFLCSMKLFVSTQNCFSFNTKYLLWTLIRMLSHGDIFSFSRSNKNIITCQKKSFLCEKKYFVFCASQIFYNRFLHFTLVAC